MIAILYRYKIRTKFIESEKRRGQAPFNPFVKDGETLAV
jgi:hypothetical protein